MEFLRATMEPDGEGFLLKVVKITPPGEDPLVPYEDTADQIVLAAKVDSFDEGKELCRRLGVELEKPL
jgi:hypothetical protein